MMTFLSMEKTTVKTGQRPAAALERSMNGFVESDREKRETFLVVSTQVSYTLEREHAVNLCNCGLDKSISANTELKLT
jgi:hypothetical protein